MLKRLLLLSVIALSIVACKNDPPKVSEDTGYPYFGEKFDMEGAMTYADMVDKMGDTERFPAKVKGTVAEVCQVKGCWMNITHEGKEDMFVKFKDYGFFMPFDIGGKEVIMNGYAFRETTTVEDLKHYAEDEGKSQEEIDAITEPIEELKFMADGVILLEKKKAEEVQ